MLSMKRDAKKPTKARQRQNLLSCLRTIVRTSGLLSGNVLLSVGNSIAPCCVAAMLTTSTGVCNNG
jgi:hypothetical protein